MPSSPALPAHMSATTTTTPPAPWQAVAAAKKAAQDALIPAHLRLPGTPPTGDLSAFPFAPLLSPRELELTSAPSVAGLLAKLQSGEWGAAEVVGAFCSRALVAHQLVNCLTEIMVESAMERARELDRVFAESGPVGPLHGLPISLKDQICVKGFDTTMGYVGWVGQPAAENAALVDVLLQQGAVPYVRTNVPQTLLWGETDNNVFGRTTNPFNTSLTCGGSSGGEGALIGLRGSVLGVGSDIGGSIRIPAAYQGLYGLRPSYNRVPYGGSVNSMMGQEIMPSVLGPMSSSLDGLAIFMKAVLAAEPWRLDPLALRMPWNDAEYRLASHGGPAGKLVFAIQWDDGVVLPTPPLTRALRLTKAALEAAGHAVVDWASHDSPAGNRLRRGLFFADGLADVLAHCALSGEPLLVPFGDARPAHLSVLEYWALTRERTGFMKAHLDHWERTREATGTGRPVDGIIGVVSANVPHPHGAVSYSAYAGLANLCDYAAVAFPVTTVDQELDRRPPPHAFLSELDEEIYSTYDVAAVANAPVGLQIHGRRNEEEGVLGMAEVVDAALKAARLGRA